MRMLKTHAPVILSFIILMCFRPFLTIHTNMIILIMYITYSMYFDPFSRAFSNGCIFGENTQHISVDQRLKCIEVYAFSNENTLVWMGFKFENEWDATWIKEFAHLFLTGYILIMQAMLTHFHLLKILIVLPHYFIDSRTGGKTQSSYSLQKQIKEYPYNTFSFKGRF